jgi:predicted DNA-binding helix-hairpin-helix protein
MLYLDCNTTAFFQIISDSSFVLPLDALYCDIVKYAPPPPKKEEMVCGICSLICIDIAEACTDVFELMMVSICHYTCKYSIERTQEILACECT